jgi:hypothetical protein
MIPTPLPSQVIHRHPDGAIDFDYCRARATLLRRKASRRILKRSGAPLALISIAVVAFLAMATTMQPAHPATPAEQQQSRPALCDGCAGQPAQMDPQ